jgi:hypothetical protein
MLQEKEDIKKPWDWKFLPVPTVKGSSSSLLSS